MRHHVSMSALSLTADLAKTHEILSRGSVQLLVRRDWKQALPVEQMLAGVPLSEWGRPVPHQLVGRGSVHVLETAMGEIVAKAYSRGGVIGALLRHWYADAERPLREAAVAEELLRRGCATPPIVAARVTRVPSGLYRLQIASARVAGARDLLDVLRAAHGAEPRASGVGVGESEEPFPWASLGQRVGATLRAVHDAGLHHRDLQVKNLLVPLGVGQLTVLDLDRCELRAPPDQTTRVQALARFARSLVKNALLPGASGGRCHPGMLAALRAFVTAYCASGAELGSRAALSRAVRVRLARSLRRHEMLWDGKNARG